MNRRNFLALLAAPLIVPEVKPPNWNPWVRIFHQDYEVPWGLGQVIDISVSDFQKLHPREQMSVLVLARDVYRNAETDELRFECRL